MSVHRTNAGPTIAFEEDDNKNGKKKKCWRNWHNSQELGVMQVVGQMISKLGGGVKGCVGSKPDMNALPAVGHEWYLPFPPEVKAERQLQAG